MKFPTLLGLLVITLVVTFGTTFLIFNDQSHKQKRLLFKPENIMIANITDTSATITWTTKEAVYGEVVYKNDNLSESWADDERGDRKFTSHFVTITGLKEATNYSFKIRNDGITYPENSYLEFKTSSQKSTDEPSILNSKQPVSTAVLIDNQTPASDTLIFLHIQGASPLATHTTDNGTFVLPLKELRTDNLQSFYNLSSPKQGELLIQNSEKKSIVKITVPVPSQTLPSLLLGQNIDLTDYLTSPSDQTPKLSFDDASSEFINKYDLNGDLKVNSLDLAIVLDNIGKRNLNERSSPSDKKVDLNTDGKIDQQDIDIIRDQIE